MNPENLYNIARTLAPDTPAREDVIQDAVFYAWQTVERKKREKKTCNYTYVRERLRRSILTALKVYERQARCEGVEGIEELVPAREDFLPFSLPLYGRQRQIAEIMIKHDFHLTDAAQELGVAKSTLSIQWSWIKRRLRNIYKEVL